MSLTILLSQEIEALLRKKAAKKGLAAGDYVRTLIEREVAPPQLSGKSPSRAAKQKVWREAFRSWLGSHGHVAGPTVPLEALRRENLYEDCR
jgi:hypothetical protein